MDKKKISIIIIFVLLITVVFSQFVYAASLCPKGKECTFRGCGRYSDTNGNSLCDVAEGVTASSQSSPAPSSQSSDTENSTLTDSSTDSSTQSESSTAGAGSVSQSGSSASADQQTDSESAESDSTDLNTATEADDLSSDDQSADTDSGNLVLSNMNVGAQFLSNNILIFAYAMFLIVAAFLYNLNLKRSLRDKIRLFLLVLSLGILGFYFGGCICPIGALQNLPLKLAGVATGQYLIWLLLMLLPILFIFIAGRIFCSSVCPLGAVQELTFRLGKKIGLNRGKPGLSSFKGLRYIKYDVLVWLVVFTAITGYTLFCSYDPFLALFTLSGSLISILLLVIVLIGSLFVSRPWCRIICPYGALLGIINRMSGREEEMRCDSCNGCKLCTRECPVDAISIVKDKNGNQIPEIDYLECINCKKCQ